MPNDETTSHGASIGSHPASWHVDRLRAECDVRFTRRSGPGGQHRNKVETAVCLTHRPTGIGAEANERRVQSQNLQVAIQRLRLRLALGIRRPWSEPSRLWTDRCRQRRLVVSPQHDDFASLLAEALDALSSNQWRTTETAEHLRCSTTQLVRLLKRHPEALAQLNRQRASCGLKPLR